MAIHPIFNAYDSPSPATVPSGTIVAAWTEQVTEALQGTSLSAAGPATASTSTVSQGSAPATARVRSVSLAIPLDDSASQAQHRRGDGLNQWQRRREPLRRDSLKRREALLRGKEGSRRRQRWENGWCS